MAKLPVGLIGIIGEELKQDHWGTLKKVAALGYRGLESVGGYRALGLTPAEYRARLDELGLSVPIMGTGVDALRKDRAAEVARIKGFGCRNAVIYWSTCGSNDEVLRDAAVFNELGAQLRNDGIRLCYHNHDHEFLQVYDGKPAMELILANSDPANLAIELDVGWVMMGKANPAAWLRRLKGRVPVIHLKDFHDLAVRESFTEVGSGKNDFHAIFEAAGEAGVEWGIVEQDKMHTRAPMESIASSIGHLKSLGVAA
ncbi:MAG: sugar phosphate isomerase/epimerase [Candidatus Coatesbacteria bacterium]